MMDILIKNLPILVVLCPLMMSLIVVLIPNIFLIYRVVGTAYFKRVFGADFCPRLYCATSPSVYKSDFILRFHQRLGSSRRHVSIDTLLLFLFLHFKQ